MSRRRAIVILLVIALIATAVATFVEIGRERAALVLTPLSPSASFMGPVRDEMTKTRQKLADGKTVTLLFPSDAGRGVPRAYEVKAVEAPAPKSWTAGVVIAEGVDASGKASVCLRLYADEWRASIAEESGVFEVSLAPEHPPQYVTGPRGTGCLVSTTDGQAPDPQILGARVAAISPRKWSTPSRRLSIAFAVDYATHAGPLKYDRDQTRLKNDLAALVTCANRTLTRDLRIELYLDESSLQLMPDQCGKKNKKFEDIVQDFFDEDPEHRPRHDLGHGIEDGGGGWARRSGVCAPGFWATAYSATTKSRVTLLADTFIHEVGHQLGAYHSFNADIEGRQQDGAYEPGTGQSVMVQHPPPPLFFHVSSIRKIHEVMSTLPFASADTCGQPYPGLGSAIQVNVPDRHVEVPPRTPFELEAVANPDILYYRWDEFDRGNDAGIEPPVFPSTSDNARTRIFPPMEWLADWDYQAHAWPAPGSTVHFMVMGRSKADVFDDEEIAVEVTKSAPFALSDFKCDQCGAGARLSFKWNKESIAIKPFNVTELTAFVFAEDMPFKRYPVASAIGNSGNFSGTWPQGIPPMARARLALKPKNQVFFALSKRFVIIKS